MKFRLFVSLPAKQSNLIILSAIRIEYNDIKTHARKETEIAWPRDERKRHVFLVIKYKSTPI